MQNLTRFLCGLRGLFSFSFGGLPEPLVLLSPRLRRLVVGEKMKYTSPSGASLTVKVLGIVGQLPDGEPLYALKRPRYRQTFIRPESALFYR